jgi:hypothetical protein
LQISALKIGFDYAGHEGQLSINPEPAGGYESYQMMLMPEAA